MIDLEYAKKIGATHYNKDSGLYYRVSGYEYIYRVSGGWSLSTRDTDSLQGLTPINFKCTKKKWVKCERLQEAIDLFESMSGEEFYNNADGKGDRINSIRLLAKAYGNCSLYRKKEVEIDWEEEVALFIKSAQTESEYHVCAVGGCNITKSNFLEMCRIALRAAGELDDKGE